MAETLTSSIGENNAVLVKTDIAEENLTGHETAAILLMIFGGKRGCRYLVASGAQ